MEVTKENLLHDEKLRKQIWQAEIIQKQLRGMCSEKEFVQASKKLETDLAAIKADLILTDSDLESFFDTLGDAVTATYCRLHYINCLTYSEIADIVGKTRPAIEKRCRRALRQKGIA